MKMRHKPATGKINMTQSSENRINRIEDNIVNLTDTQARTQVQLDQLTGRVDQLSGKVDEFVFQSQRLFTRLGTIVERVDGRTESLEAIVRRLDRNHEEQKSQWREFQVTTNASLERIDRVLDFLVREQGRGEA
jgi:chromosome segregation ATPase